MAASKGLLAVGGAGRRIWTVAFVIARLREKSYWVAFVTASRVWLRI